MTPSESPAIHGHCETAFEPLRGALAEILTAGSEVGAALAVYVDGSTGTCVSSSISSTRRSREIAGREDDHRNAKATPILIRTSPGDSPEYHAAEVIDHAEAAALIGIEFTTFSLIGRCERTGMFGIAIATSEMAVGSRCIHVAPGVGAVVTQASTNPRLGHLGLNLLRAGYSAPRVLEEIAASDQFVERRQLGCLDVSGLAAARTGADNKPWAGHRVDRNVVVTANAVVSPEVADAMFGEFQGGTDLPLWERLLRSLEAGKAAGGQPGGEVSSGLYVVDREPFAMVDLRVDLHPEPVAELRRLADAYFPLVSYYNLRPRDPNVPSAVEWLTAQRRPGGR